MVTGRLYSPRASHERADRHGGRGVADGQPPGRAPHEPQNGGIPLCLLELVEATLNALLFLLISLSRCWCLCAARLRLADRLACAPRYPARAPGAAQPPPSRCRLVAQRRELLRQGARSRSSPGGGLRGGRRHRARPVGAGLRAALGDPHGDGSGGSLLHRRPGPHACAGGAALSRKNWPHGLRARSGILRQRLPREEAKQEFWWAPPPARVSRGLHCRLETSGPEPHPGAGSKRMAMCKDFTVCLVPHSAGPRDHPASAQGAVPEKRLVIPRSRRVPSSLRTWPDAAGSRSKNPISLLVMVVLQIDRVG